MKLDVEIEGILETARKTVVNWLLCLDEIADRCLLISENASHAFTR
jgi:hypothetical protein